MFNLIFEPIETDLLVFATPYNPPKEPSIVTLYIQPLRFPQINQYIHHLRKRNRTRKRCIIGFAVSSFRRTSSPSIGEYYINNFIHIKRNRVPRRSRLASLSFFGFFQPPCSSLFPLFETWLTKSISRLEYSDEQL